MFRADRLLVFPDREGERRWGEEFVRVVLQYAATPPYLKNEVWGKRDELQFAGILPPLRVSSQTVADPDDGPATHQGIVTKVGSEGRVRVTCGLQHPISLMVPPEMATPTEGERVTVRISSREPVRARLVDEPISGLVVECMGLSAALSDESGLTVAASEYGEKLTHTRLGGLLPELREGMTVGFGSPGRGLPEILGITPEAVSAAVAAGDHVESDPGFDRWLNTIPRQASETVRTEEAMFASLGCLTLTE